MFDKYLYVANQHWKFESYSEIPGLFRIASATAPTLYLTSPPNPKNGDKLFMDTKYEGVGKNVHQQLWRFIPGGGDGNSVIQGYTINGRVIDVPYGKSGEPIHMWDNLFGTNQLFYIDIAKVYPETVG